MNKITTMEGMMQSSLKLLAEVEEHGRDIQLESFATSFGVVILESVQVGFLFSAQMGTGILCRHDKDTGKWSRPLAVGLTGGGVGLSVGAEKKHMIVFLSSNQMDETLMASDFSLSLGLEQSYALGPAGEGNECAATVGNTGTGVSGSYGTAVGLYTGLQAGGTVLAPRTAINKKFYGEKLSPNDILFGEGSTGQVPDSQPTLKKLHTKLNDLTAKGQKKADFQKANELTQGQHR